MLALSSSSSSGTRGMTTNQQPMNAANGSYELYDGEYIMKKNPSLENEHLSPPGGPSCHPPGSPKQMKETERLKYEVNRLQRELFNYKKTNEDLQKQVQLQGVSPDPLLGCEDASQESAVEDIRDSQIRHLRRQITILQADIHKKQGLEHRLIELTKEKNLSDDRLRLLVEKLEKLNEENHSLRGQTQRLESTIKQQKEELDRLLSEKAITKTRSNGSYDSASPPSSSSSSSSFTPTNGVTTILQSLASSGDPTYIRELDSLHKMVDMLKATVLEQRNVLIKLGLTNRSFSSMPPRQPQSSAVSSTVSASSSPHQAPASRSNVSTAPSTNAGPATIPNGTPSAGALQASTTPLPSVQQSSLAMTARPVRQAEESSDTILPTPSSSSPNTIIDSNLALKVHSSASRDGNVGVGQEKISLTSHHPKFDGRREGGDGNTNHHLSTSGVSSSLAGGVENSNFYHSPSHILAPSGIPRSRPGSVSSSDLISGVEKLNVNAGLDAVRNVLPPSTSNVEDQIYVNDAIGLAHAVSKREAPVGDQPVIRNGAAAFSQRASPSRKQQSEIIDRRTDLIEGAPLPVKSRTEIFGKNPVDIPSSSSPSSSPHLILQQHQNLHHQHQHHYQQPQQQRHHQQQRQQQQQQQIRKVGVPNLDIARPPQLSDNNTAGGAVRLQQYPPGFPVVPPSPTSVVGGAAAATRFGATTNGLLRGGGRGSGAAMIAGGIPGGTRLPAPRPWQNGGPHQLPTTTTSTSTATSRPPYEAEGCVVSPVPSDYSNTLSNISEVRSSSSTSSHQPPPPLPRHQREDTHNNTATANINSGRNNTNTTRPNTTASGGGSNNRLCPVCNQDFGHISMEDFQTHVFDCFDNDNGPETLQAEMATSDYPQPQQILMGGGGGLRPHLGKSCPMCQKQFDPSTTQVEFEQHVHRHFGEESFEEL